MEQIDMKELVEFKEKWGEFKPAFMKLIKGVSTLSDGLFERYLVEMQGCIDTRKYINAVREFGRNNGVERLKAAYAEMDEILSRV